jgi:hypothetical protein
MFAPITHQTSFTKIRRERLLPLPGTVMVTTGQQVKATDVIAETRVANQHLMLDVAQQLKISARQAQNLMNVNVNQLVERGEVIAGPTGFPPRSVKFPEQGKVVYIHDGQVLLELDTPPYRLFAGLEGEIRNIIPDRGAILETEGALLQGIWGNGKISQGNLVSLMRSPSTELTGEDFEGDLSEAIIVSGCVCRKETLQYCRQFNIRGLILASLSASLVPLAAQARFPIIILDGFGKIPMNSAACRILTENAGKVIALNACGWERSTDSRPEIIIPLPEIKAADYSLPDAILAPGKRVRINSSDLRGKVGKLIALNTEQAMLANGIMTRVATIHLENGEQTYVPLANLELLA